MNSGKMKSRLLLGTLIALVAWFVHFTATTMLINTQGVRTKPRSFTQEFRGGKGEFIMDENIRAIRSGERVFLHFMSHIPKTAGTYALRVINKLLNNTPEWQSLEEPVRFRGCRLNFHSALLEKVAALPIGSPCTLLVAEKPYSVVPRHVYTIMRNPLTHVVSQFFHCKESRDHKNLRSHTENVTFTDWLQYWTTELGNETKYEGLHHEEEKFYCYVPLNMQAQYLPKPSGSDYEKVLESKYDVIGDQSQLDLSMCMIAIRFSGLFPPACNCTGRNPSSRELRTDHGVSHHGDSFQLSETQENLIKRLTQTDQNIYEIAKRVFARQVSQVEREYGAKICRTMME